MFAKKEDHVRDGKHCDLCGCTNPAVRCDKCNSQVFCLSCDDMYHRHPKRRLHLRKAVDSFNPKLPSARPVTPNKPPPGDPSKMPIPPPRKKKPKNFFGTLMRGSSPNESPVLPKKEFSWMDKFGTIKRFMSNRPLPPLPAESSPSPEPAFPIGTIYQNVPDRLDGTQPPLPRIALPRRHSNPSFPNGTLHVNGTSSHHHPTDFEQDERPIPPPKQNQFTSQNEEQFGVNRARGNSVAEPGKWGQGSKIPPDSPTLPMEYPIGDKHVMNHPGMMPNYATFRRISPHTGLIKSRSPSPSPTHEGSSSMHQSASLTDLNSLPATPGPYPYYPHHPHQPFLPMFPAHSYAHLNCPQCYVGPWPPSADNCEYCNSSNDPKHKHAHHSAGNRVKRSQSVMYDNMNNPMPYFPFAPGYGPFYPHGHHFETPPSPTSSARSLQNANRQRRKHNTDDNASVASSNRSRGKSTSSGQQKSVDNESMEISSDEEEEDEEEEEIDNKKKSGINQNSGVKVEERNAASPQPRNPLKPWTPNESWSCEYCTYINPPGIRICTICCKTITVIGSADKNMQEGEQSGELLEPEGAQSGPLSNDADLATENNVSQLTSALDEAEKEMNKELNELMKVKDQSREEGKTKEEVTETKNDEAVESQTQKIRYCEIAIGTDTLSEPTENESVHVNTTEHDVTETSTPATSALNSVKRRDSSCQTYDNVTLAANADIKFDVPHAPPPLTNGYDGHAETRTVSLGTSPPNYQREDAVSAQFYPERSNLAGMRRSLSRLSLNYGPRQSEYRQQQYQNQDWLGYGEPLYRSVSQSSLTGDSDIWSPDLRRKKPDYYLSIEELVERRRQEAMRAQGLEIVRMIREAEQKGFTADDLQIALNNCGKSNPVEWLENNWKNMVKTVVTLATNYGHDKKENDIGIVSSNEAREALKIHKGNIWAAVTECVESRQRKFLELSARGNFNRKEVIGALTSNEGNVELAYTELTKATLKPFLMRIWGQGSGAENESGVVLRQHKSETRNLYNENMKTNSVYDNFPQKDDYDLELDNDYSWNDGVSDASFREYDGKLDSRSNDDDYEYENSYDYPEYNYKYDKKGNLVPRNHNIGDFHAEYDEALDLSQQAKAVENKKEESKKNRSSGFLSKLVSLKKTNKDQPKPETAAKVVENYKEEDSCKTNSKNLQAVSNENVSKQKVKSENVTNKDEDNMKSVENLVTASNSDSLPTASSQVNEVKKSSIKANSSFSNLLKHFSSDKSVSSKAESDSSSSKNSAKDKSLTSKEISDVTERNSSKSPHKDEEKVVEKSEETEKATKSEEVRESVDNKDTNTTKANLETEKVTHSELNNVENKEEVKEIKSATGAISKNTKRSETSMIGKTIGKFNFMSAKSTVDKKSPEITRTIKKQTENTPLNQNKAKEKSIQPVKDQDSRSESPSSPSPSSPTPLKDIVNINSNEKEESKSVDVKTERTGSPLGKKNIFNRFSGEKTEGKTLGKKEMPTVNASSPKTDDILGKKRAWMPSLQKPNEKQLIFERKVRRLLAEEKCDTYERAEIAVKLMEMNFNDDDVIQAMKDCTSLDQAFTYLQQDCELCVGVYPASKMVSMIHCIHRACRDCLRTYFTIQIRDRNIRELMCPYCNEPDLDNEDIAMDYFNHLDIMLKKLVDPDIHELFQQKLRDRVLMKDPNFHWCSQCSSGFIAVPDLTKLACPDCKAVTCAQCRRLWEKQHEGISCEQFTEWKEANDPEAQAAGLAKHLTDNGIDCPNCKFRYSLAKGGCMHFRCIQCQYDFCSGCGKPFKMGQKCTVSDFCAKLGLHAHHPRNCLFYLRDKEPTDLQKLLDENDIAYNREPSEGTEVQNVCQVMEQKETPQGMKDDICGKEVEQEYAGLCRLHFVEYLVSLVNRNYIDPLPILDLQDMQLVLRRGQIAVPERDDREGDERYREKLTKLIQEKLPLEVPEGS